MKKWAVVFSWLCLVVSCKGSRTLDRGRDFDEGMTTETRITARPSDTLVYTVPVFRYRDTTITTVSRNNTRLEMVYDTAGRIQTIYCIPPEILEYLDRSSKEKSEDTYKKVESEWRTIDYFYLASIIAIFLLLLIKLPSLKVR